MITGSSFVSNSTTSFIFSSLKLHYLTKVSWMSPLSSLCKSSFEKQASRFSSLPLWSVDYLSTVVFSPRCDGSSDQLWPSVICVETKTGMLLLHSGSWKKSVEAFMTGNESPVLYHSGPRCELPWCSEVCVGRALERSWLAMFPIHPELLLLFYS